MKIGATGGLKLNDNPAYYAIELVGNILNLVVLSLVTSCYFAYCIMWHTPVFSIMGVKSVKWTVVRADCSLVLVSN